MVSHLKKDEFGDGWLSETFIDQQTGRATTSYFYKRRPVKHIVLDSHLAQQAAGYYIIDYDLKRVSEWLAEIDRTSPHRKENPTLKGFSEESPIVSALFIAALTIYGKCFSKAEGRRVKLEKKIFDKTHLEAHNYFIHLRNNLAAHSGRTSFEHAETVLVLPPRNKANILPQLFSSIEQAEYTDSSGIESGAKTASFEELIEYIRAWVQEKYKTLMQIIEEQEVQKRVQKTTK